MNNLLLPEWFDPWFWVIASFILVAAIIVLIVFIIKSGKNANGGREESAPDKAGVEDKEEKMERKAPSTKTYHIARRKDDGKWQVKAAGAIKAIKLFDTQAEAIEFAKTLADNQEANIMIHKKDGSFRKSDY